MKVSLRLASALALSVPAALSAQTVVFDSDFNIPDTTDPLAAGFSYQLNDGSGIDYAVVSNEFRITRTTTASQSNVGFSPFSSTGPVVVASFDMNFTGAGSTITDYKFGVSFFVGTGMSTNAQQAPTTNGVVANGNVFSYFNLNTKGASEGGANGGWGVIAGQDFDGIPVSPTNLYTSTQSVLWVMNDGTSAYSYTDPNGGTSSVAAGSWDLWLGTNLEVDDKGATLSWATEEGLGNDQVIDSFKIRWHRNEANGNTLTFDNMQFVVVPEPSTYALIGGLVALGAVALRRRLRK